MSASRFGPATGRASLLQPEHPEQVAPSRPVVSRLEEFVQPPARLGQEVLCLVEKWRALAGGHGLEHQVVDHLDDRLPHERPPFAARPGHPRHQRNDRARARLRSLAVARLAHACPPSGCAPGAPDSPGAPPGWPGTGDSSARSRSISPGRARSMISTSENARPPGEPSPSVTGSDSRNTSNRGLAALSPTVSTYRSTACRSGR